MSLARWVGDHRRLVVALWVLVLACALATARAVGSQYANNSSLPGTDAQRADDLLSTEVRHLGPLAHHRFGKETVTALARPV